MNYSATRSDFKVMKGITTDIHFFLRNTDRQVVTLEAGEYLSVVIKDKTNQHLLGTFQLELFNPDHSIWMLSLPKEEVENWPLGNLRYAMLHHRADGTETMIYLDRGFGAESDVFVLDGPYPIEPQPETHLPSDFSLHDGRLISSAIVGSLNELFPQTEYSVVFHANEHRGRVTVQGTLDAQPSSDPDLWFDIVSQDTWDTNGIIDLHFEGSYEWLRFVIHQTDGEITKIVLSR